METEHLKAEPRSSTPWNKGRLPGAKPPLQPKHVWAIRPRLPNPPPRLPTTQNGGSRYA